MLGRLVELISTAPASSSGRPRVATLSSGDEQLLRDGDLRQLGPTLLEIARSGGAAAWRAGISEHFRRRYDLSLAFDATATRVS